jgi:hypothetical protein
MAIGSRMFNRGMFSIINQETNFDTADIEVMLLASSYSFNPDSNVVSDIVASEISTTNYARQNVANTTVTESDAADSVVLDGDNNLWTALGPGSGGPIVGSAALFRNTGSDATSPLLVNLGFANTQVNGGDFTVAYNAAGMIVTTSP